MLGFSSQSYQQFCSSDIRASTNSVPPSCWKQAVLPCTQAKSQGTQAWRHAAKTEEDHSNTQQRLNVASGNFISIHQKLKPKLWIFSLLRICFKHRLIMNLWTGIRGHGDQQLARRGWSQQAVLLWHSWGENVPGTWLAPWRELADGTDSGVCVLI